ncbi:MAG TPA: hypothetical protein VK013_12880 [Myxococcaceae bacterium]|nr:hypothetical protein [Myxococcaceae bacterium]
MSLRPLFRSSPQPGVLALVAALSLVGCKQGEDLDRRIAHVQEQVDALKADLAREEALVEEVRALQIEEARFSQALFAPTIETIEAAFATLPGVRVLAGRADAIVVTGRAPLPDFTRQLLELGSAQPGLQVQVFNVDRDAVEVQLAVVRPETPPGPARERPLGMVFPWNGDSRDRLRALEAEREQLREQLPEFVLERDTMRWRLNEARGLLSEAHRSRVAMVTVARAFTPEVGLGPIELEWDAGRVKFGGRPNGSFTISRLREPVEGLERFEITSVAAPSDNWVSAIIVPPLELPQPDTTGQEGHEGEASPSPSAEAPSAAADGEAPSVAGQTSP